MKLQDVLILAALGVAVYVATKLTNVGSAATGYTADKIADFILWVTQSKPNAAAGTIIFESGATLPVASINLNHVGNNVMQFSHQGKTYRLLARTSNGYYPAVPA